MKGSLPKFLKHLGVEAERKIPEEQRKKRSAYMKKYYLEGNHPRKPDPTWNKPSMTNKEKIDQVLEELKRSGKKMFCPADIAKKVNTDSLSVGRHLRMVDSVERVSRSRSYGSPAVWRFKDEAQL